MSFIKELASWRMSSSWLLATVVCVVICVALFGGPDSSEAFCKTDPTVLVSSIVKTCWECMFPIGMSGFILFPGDQDMVSPPEGPGISAVYPPLLCGCACLTPMLCLPGLPIGYFEPVRLVEVVHDMLCFPSLGVSFGSGGFTFIGQGSESTQIDALDQNHSYMQAHYLAFPLWYWVGLIVDGFCLNYSVEDLDVLFVSEVDPTWNDDFLALLIAPETLLIANPVALMACVADAVSAAVGFPIDALFWCAGSSGYMYPMNGNVSGAGSDINAAMLNTYRMLAKLARLGLETWNSADGKLICTDLPTGLIVKGQYKFQLLYPIPNFTGEGCCFPIGRTPFRWGQGKEIPAVGEDFVWLVWKLQRCCLL